MNASPARNRLRKIPFPLGGRRPCDVCGLLEVEHPDRGGNLCYRRAVAVRFPMSAVARQRFPTAIQVHRATVRGILLQGPAEALSKALSRAS